MKISKDHKGAIIETIHDAQNGIIDEDFEHDLFTMDDVRDNDLDIVLLQAMADIEKTKFWVARIVNGSWRWEWKAISQGEYPLEKLPEHVREIARSLYYGKNKNQG